MDRKLAACPMLPVGAVFTVCLHIVFCVFTPLVQLHVTAAGGDAGHKNTTTAFAQWFLTHD